MNEPTPEVLSQLAQAAQRRATEQQGTTTPEAPPPGTPKPAKQPTTQASNAPDGSPSAGNSTAKYLLTDHYFGGSNGTLWTYDGTSWRAAGTSQPSDEQGIAQVAFTANRVDMWWDDNDSVTVLRAWKYL